MEEAVVRELIENVRQMRYWQRIFFASPPNSPDRKHAFDEARGFEARVDAILKEQPHVQPPLFDVAE